MSSLLTDHSLPFAARNAPVWQRIFRRLWTLYLGPPARKEPACKQQHDSGDGNEKDRDAEAEDSPGFEHQFLMYALAYPPKGNHQLIIRKD